MRTLLPLLFFLAQPFWEAKLPEEWTEREIDLLRHNSPWAQSVGPAPNILVYLSTARPIEEAESEVRVRARQPFREPDPDYLNYLSENRERHFVVAIPYANATRANSPEDEKRMVAESVMVIGRKTYKLIGHFPPAPADPVLRLVFPREVQDTDKRVQFRLYVPGIEFPDRQLEFNVKDLMYHGRLEM